jgi:hypothetical protein
MPSSIVHLEKIYLLHHRLSLLLRKNTNALPSKASRLKKIYLLPASSTLENSTTIFFSEKIYLLPASSTWEKYYCLLL